MGLGHVAKPDNYLDRALPESWQGEGVAMMGLKTKFEIEVDALQRGLNLELCPYPPDRAYPQCCFQLLTPQLMILPNASAAPPLPRIAPPATQLSWPSSTCSPA
jgi:hypothetical protein